MLKKRRSVRDDGVDARINDNNGDASAGDDREVKKNPSLAGRIMINLTINSGKNKVKFPTDTLKSENLKKCIKRKVKKWKFPSKCKGVMVSKTYVLSTD